MKSAQSMRVGKQKFISIFENLSNYENLLHSDKLFSFKSHFFLKASFAWERFYCYNFAKG